jgi:hypothetical protein
LNSCNYITNNVNNLSSYYTKTDTDTLLNAKQATLTAGTNILGIGSAITALDFNKITINKPTTYPADMTNIYTKTEVNALSTLNNFYNKIDSDGRFLKLSGGTITGDLAFTNRISNFIINLWGINEYGFGINGGMLRYNSQGSHTFFSGGVQRVNFDSGGSITNTGSINASGLIKSSSGVSEFNYVWINNPGRAQSHFPYTNGENYIRGKLNIDQDGLYVGGAVSFNSSLSVNGNMSGAPNVCKRVAFLFDTQYIFTTIGYRYVKFINLNSYISKNIGVIGNEQFIFRITIYSASGDFGDSSANVETMQYLIFLAQWGGTGFKVRTYQIANESNGSFVAADSYSSVFYSGWNGTGGASQKNCIIENIAGY